jgi:hypothetical protein
VFVFRSRERTDVHHKIIRAKTPMSAKSKVEAFIRKMSSTSRELFSEILGSLPRLIDISPEHESVTTPYRVLTQICYNFLLSLN